MYIDLLKKVLVDYHRINEIEYRPVYESRGNFKSKLVVFANKRLAKFGLAICKRFNFKKENRINGKDWPANADTMIGLKRLDNIEYCLKNILKDNIESDVIETGVWRGGATIFMKAILRYNNVTDRNVWVADSFEGLPKPNEQKYAADKNDKHFTRSELAISMETVKSNFEKYGLLDEHVKFLKGWFKDTLPNAPISKLSLLRLDGDMYESTMDAITVLYPKLSIGGYLIVDDWGAVAGCKKAIEDYRKENNITEPIIEIDWTGVYWRKER